MSFLPWALQSKPPPSPPPPLLPPYPLRVHIQTELLVTEFYTLILPLKSLFHYNGRSLRAEWFTPICLSSPWNHLWHRAISPHGFGWIDGLMITHELCDGKQYRTTDVKPLSHTASLKLFLIFPLVKNRIVQYSAEEPDIIEYFFCDSS